MITEEQAIKAAREFLEKEGYDLSDQKLEASLHTLQSLEASKLKTLEKTKPRAWEMLQQLHRDSWGIIVQPKRPKKNGKRKSFVVKVDAVSGNVSLAFALSR